MLFNRAGQPHEPNGYDSKSGRPYYRYVPKCGRCGGHGGSEAWRYTGYNCYDCGGTGLGQPRREPLYTQDQLDRLNAARAKAAARRAQLAAEQRAAEEARQAAERAEWQVRNADFLRKLDRLAGDEYWAGFAKDFNARVRDPSPRQVEVVDAALARIAARAASEYIGKEGDRVELDLVVDRVVDITPANQPYGFGRRYLYLLRAGANRVVYKGDCLPFEGEFRVKASIKGHEAYQGEKQTLIARPKVLA